MWAIATERSADLFASRLTRLSLFALVYFLGAELGHALAFRGVFGEFATYWPPCGIYLAAMLSTKGVRNRLDLVLVACLANITSDVAVHGLPLPVSMGFCAANTAGALAGAWGARRAGILTGETFTVRDIAGLAIVSVVCSGFVAALIGGFTLHLGFGGPFVEAFREWWISACVGELVFLPLCWQLLNGVVHFRRNFSWPRLAEGASALICLALLSWVIFHIGVRPMVYLTFPVSLWLALRVGATGVVIGNVLLSVIAVWHTARGEGPLGQIQPHTLQAIFVQVFNVVASLSSLMLVAVVNERQRALDECAESENRYRDLFDNISDLVAVTDADGRLLFANQAWHDFIGVPKSASDEDWLLAEALHPEDRELFDHLLTVLPAAGSLSGIELRLVTSEHAIMDVEGSFSCRSTTGATNRIRIILRDVTMRKVGAQRLEHAHRQLEAANIQLQALAATDALTALANRRAFYERLDQECQAAERHERPLSVVMLDIDHFKSYNDSFGHPAGDDVLRTIGWLLKDCIREIDVAGRIGGEEFAVILPDTDDAGALRVAERIRISIGKHGWPLRQVTASLGVATLYGANAGAEDVMQSADQALYQAKRGGRDQTVRAPTRRLVEAI